MALTSLARHFANISYRGETFPNANGQGYYINLEHPYAGMGIELELKKYSGWSVPSNVVETFNNELEPKAYPDFYSEPENIVLTYACYTPFKQIPEKPLNETRTPWNARPIFEVGSGFYTFTHDDTPGAGWWPAMEREGIIISRNIYTNEKTPILEVVIKPLFPGWRRYGNKTAGQTQNIISPLFGPVPFSFEAKTEAAPQSGVLSINLFVKRQGQNYYKNFPTQKQYAPEPVTDRISFYGPQIQSGDIVTFKFDSAFPYKATIEAASIGTVNLAPYLYNENSGYVISSPRLFIPGGGATVNVWAEFRVGSSTILATSQTINFVETLIL